MEMDRGLVDGQDSVHDHTHRSMDGNEGDSRGGFWAVEGWGMDNMGQMVVVVVQTCVRWEWDHYGYFLQGGPSLPSSLHACAPGEFAASFLQPSDQSHGLPSLARLIFGSYFPQVGKISPYFR